jgi:hypothetical protein
MVDQREVNQYSLSRWLVETGIDNTIIMSFAEESVAPID